MYKLTQQRSESTKQWDFMQKCSLVFAENVFLTDNKVIESRDILNRRKININNLFAYTP